MVEKRNGKRMAKVHKEEKEEQDEEEEEETSQQYGWRTDRARGSAR